MVKWFKQLGDSTIPSKKQDLLQRYELICTRVETERSRKKDDEDAVVDDAENGEHEAGGEE